jgi:mycothiol synthase
VTVELRPPRREDAAAIAAALNEFSLALDTDPDTPEEVESWLDLPSLDLERDVRIALADRTIVGYGEGSSAEGRFLWADVRANPAHADASLALLDFVEARARELAAPGGMIKAWAPEKATAWRSLLESQGYVLHHYSLRMLGELENELPEPEWPDGISVRTFETGDQEYVYEVHQETFSDQRDFSCEPFDDWKHWSMREPFDPELWFLAKAENEIQGISLCRAEWAGDPDLGWVSVIGVRKPWRRRGLGLALLRHSFRELRAHGKKRVGLVVDAENPTGAVRLYERAGLEEQRRHIWYEKAAT